jgi:hypothetical protein
MKTSPFNSFLGSSFGSSFRSCVLLAIVLSFGVGCAKKLDDAKMSSDIQSKFSQDSGLSSKQLSVQANDGVVTLSGNVDNTAQRDAAGRQAASVPGVKTVINNLQVGDSPAPASAAAPATVAPASSKPSVAGNGKPGNGPPAGKPIKTRAMKESSAPQMAAGSSNNQAASSNEQAPDAAQSAPPPQDNAPAEATPPPPPRPKEWIIDQGTTVTVRLIDPIDSEKNQVGDTFHATLHVALNSDGQEAVPAGVELTGHVVDVKSASKFAGKSLVALQLDTLSYAGKSYSLQTDQYKKEGTSRGKNTAEKVGGGAILGGIIGAIAGGGKGAAIGTAAGAGVGGGVQAASKSQQIKLPSETVLNFTLQAPFTVVEGNGSDANRPKLGDSQ